MKKHKIITFVFIVVIIVLKLQTAYADTEENLSHNLLDEYATFYGDIFNREISNANDAEELFDFVPEFDAEKIIKQLNSGEFIVSPKGVLQYLLKLLMGEVYTGLKMMALILALSVLVSYLSGIKSGFGEDAVSKCAYYICYIIIAGIASSAFYQTATSAMKAVEAIGFFMRVIVPVLITFLMTSGAIVSASTLEPTFFAISEVAVWVIECVFIPAVMISAALNIVNGMSDKFKTDRMVKLLNNSVKWGLTAILTIFVSLAGLKSIAASGVDGLTVKLSKFATSNLVPMVGGILAESVETVMSCSVVIKNSVGIFGIICVAAIALGPLIKLGAMLILFRITAAVAEPVSDEKIVVCISRLADSISALFSMVTAVVVMFIMVVTIILNAGNSAIMLGR